MDAGTTNDDLTAREAEKERLAEQAAERIAGGQHWIDWMDVGEGLAVGRAAAMRRAGSNQPKGRGYNVAFNAWLSDRAWAKKIDQKTRADLFWCVDHQSEIEAWRETLGGNERLKLNHPTTLKRRYLATHRLSDAAAPEKESQMVTLQRKIARLEEDNMRWRKRAETEGSLFDLKKDTTKDIARTIAAHVGFHRLCTLQKDIAEEIRKAKAEQKHAG